jgi:hypothetical protein
MDFEEKTEDFDNLLDTGQSAKATLVQRIYARTCNFLSALKELDKSGSGTLDPDGEKDAVFGKYLDLCYVFGQDGKINGAKNPLDINFDGSGWLISPKL